MVPVFDLVCRPCECGAFEQKWLFLCHNITLVTECKLVGSECLLHTWVYRKSASLCRIAAKSHAYTAAVSCNLRAVQALQVTSPPPGQKTLSGFLQGGGARDSRPPRGAAEAPAADDAGGGTEDAGASAGQPEPMCGGQGSGSGPGPGGREDASGAARAASAYFAVATHAPGGRARLPGAYGNAGRGAGPLGAQSGGGGGPAGAGAAAGRYPGTGPDPGDEAGEGCESQGIMPSLRDWAALPAAPGDASGSGGGAAQEGVSLAVCRGACDVEESGWPEGYFPVEEEAAWGDRGGAEDEEGAEAEDLDAAALADPGDLGCPTLAPRKVPLGNRVGDELEEEAAGACANASAHAVGHAGQPGDAGGSMGGGLRDRGALTRWQCLVCTFAGNRAEVLRCALCDTLKGSRAWQPLRGAQAGTLPEALPGSLAATVDLLERASGQVPGSRDALEMQRRESGPGHEPGPRGTGSSASERCTGGAGRGGGTSDRGAQGRKRKPSGDPKRSVRERSRRSRGTMDAFLLRANAQGS